MYLSFYDENNLFLTPEVIDEVRSDTHAVKEILEPPFNNNLPEEDYALFSSGKSVLPSSMATQFEDYLTFILNKVNNWEAYRNAYSYRRLAIIDYEEGEPTPIWYSTPSTEKMEVYTPPATEVAEPAATEEEMSFGELPCTLQSNIGNLTLNEAIELIKQKAAAASSASEIQEKLLIFQSELDELEKRKASILGAIQELKQQFAELPSTEEYEAISKLALTLSQLIPQQ
jgi:hypothetical protein